MIIYHLYKKIGPIFCLNNKPVRFFRYMYLTFWAQGWWGRCQPKKIYRSYFLLYTKSRTDFLFLQNIGTIFVYPQNLVPIFLYKQKFEPIFFIINKKSDRFFFFIHKIVPFVFVYQTNCLLYTKKIGPIFCIYKSRSGFLYIIKNRPDFLFIQKVGSIFLIQFPTFCINKKSDRFCV